jgi:hypothetical protein
MGAGVMGAAGCGMSSPAYRFSIGHPPDFAGNSVTTVISGLSTGATMLPYLSLQRRQSFRGSSVWGSGDHSQSSGLEDAGGNAAVAQGMGCMGAASKWTIPQG